MGTKTKTLNDYLPAGELMVAIFPDPETRPSRRWLYQQVEKGNIPHEDKGVMLFDPVAVRAALVGKGLIAA